MDPTWSLRKFNRGRSKRRQKKTTQNTCDGLENHRLGCHFAVQIDLKSLPERFGAPLERPGVSWSAPRTASGCSRDAPGTFPGRFGTLGGAPRMPLGGSGALFGRLMVSSGALLGRTCSQICGHAVSGSIWCRFFTICSIVVRIDFRFFFVCFC